MACIPISMNQSLNILYSNSHITRKDSCNQSQLNYGCFIIVTSLILIEIYT
uniref:Uncharacterized protein n=1 Tax=Rhizophora mucronata TaxID=61149 RepID=A0A2P2NH64_RHIMU